MVVDDLNDPINAKIQKQQVNNYVNRKTGLRSSLDKIYGLLWVQCSYVVKSIICNNEYFGEKSDVFECLFSI